ncbi:MAG: ATP--guanido phosphotransferase [Fastidiosipilaceae bacterium]|jgi:protein arginine kinase
MSWYLEDGPSADVILSSRVRLARNAGNYAFTSRLKEADAVKLADELSEAFFSANSAMHDHYYELDLSALTPVDRDALVEHRLISAELAERIKQNKQSPRVLLDKDESVSIMIGEEDHLRIQAMMAGLDLKTAYRRAEEVAMLFEEKVLIAWDPHFGFLTACPTNTGTGMRASVMVHLPGLTELKQMDNLQKRLTAMGFALRGNLGENSRAEGNVYQISNQVTLGMSEQDLLQDLSNIVDQVIDLERQARVQIQQVLGLALDDRVFRSLGVLRHARSLPGQEATRCLSDVAFGEEIGIIKKIGEGRVKTAMSLIGAASIQQKIGRELDARGRDVERATAMREIFAQYDM